MSGSLDDMYREIILDHYRSPRGKKPLDGPDVSSDGQNPSCGDELCLQLKVKAGLVNDVHVNCTGCAISVASASMLAEVVKGKSVEEVEELAAVVKKMLKGESTELPEDFGDLDALKGVRKFPVRIKCALLAWVTLVEGLRNFDNGHSGDTQTTTTESEE